MRPAVPLYWRCTPTQCTPFFTSPVSSTYAEPVTMPAPELCRGLCSVMRTLLVGWVSGMCCGRGARHSYRLSRKASSESAGR